MIINLYFAVAEIKYDVHRCVVEYFYAKGLDA